MAASISATRKLAMEALLPQAISEKWTVQQLAKRTPCAFGTASRFLKRKMAMIEKQSNCKILAFSHEAGAVFKGAAGRQMRRLVKLAEKDEDDWTADDYRLEKHAIALLKPLMEWSKASPDDGPGSPDVPQLSDGL